MEFSEKNRRERKKKTDSRYRATSRTLRLPTMKSTIVMVTPMMMILDLTFCNQARRCALLAASLNSFPAMLRRSLVSCRSSSLSPRSTTFCTLSRIMSATSWICSFTLQAQTVYFDSTSSVGDYSSRQAIESLRRNRELRESLFLRS